MKPEDFLSKLNKLPEEARASFSASILSLSKVAAAEAIRPMLHDANFGVKINAIKAIRKNQLNIYERELLQLLIDDSFEVKIATIKTLASFGDFKHFKLIKTFYLEQTTSRHLIIDSFTNYSDQEDVYPFILAQILDPHEKVRQEAIAWFSKAFKHNILLPWILSAYKEVDFNLKRTFENIFADDLPKLFHDTDVGNRFKLSYIISRRSS
jgi:hypothetical protein